MENSMKVPEKPNNRAIIWSSNLTPGHISRKGENSNLESYMHPPVFTAAVFTIAKTWKQPKCSTTDEWIKKMWCVYIQWNTTYSN